MVHWKISPDFVSYLDAVNYMEDHVAAMYQGKAEEQIWLLEHPPLITAGGRAQGGDLLEPKRFPVFTTSRGGQYTYHGPGQRVGYVMLNLNRRGRDVRHFVWLIEEWLIRSFARFGLRVQRREARIGLWVIDRQGERKIAAVGLRLRKWISYHGFSVNIEPDLEHFNAIVPCGLKATEYGVTSLVAEGYPVTMGDFDLALQQTFDDVFGHHISVES